MREQSKTTKKSIIIKKDHIEFFGEKLYPPFYINEVKKVLGEGKVILPHDEIIKSFYVWDELGIQAWMNDELTEAEAFGICIGRHERVLPEKLYDGNIFIGNKDYREVKWKNEICFSQEKKLGCFEIYTLMPSELADVDKKFEDDALYMSSIVEVDYEPGNIKKNESKYVQREPEEPALKFTHFNFKLAVIQSLMYEKKLLNPQFDIYEFAEEYNKRMINIDKEGYGPIKEAVEWFENIAVPERLANEIEVLTMDGGNNIYHQIIPFWDGEDNYFDVDALDEEEVKQFGNLRHITLMSVNPDKAVETLEKCNITYDF